MFEMLPRGAELRISISRVCVEGESGGETKIGTWVRWSEGTGYVFVETTEPSMLKETLVLT